MSKNSHGKRQRPLAETVNIHKAYRKFSDEQLVEAIEGLQNLNNGDQVDIKTGVVLQDAGLEYNSAHNTMCVKFPQRFFDFVQDLHDSGSDELIGRLSECKALDRLITIPNEFCIGLTTDALSLLGRDPHAEMSAPTAPAAAYFSVAN